jgi:hypothetical protein
MGESQRSESQNGHRMTPACGKEILAGPQEGPQEGHHRRRRERVLDHAHRHHMLAVNNRCNDQSSVNPEPGVS